MIDISWGSFRVALIMILTAVWFYLLVDSLGKNE
jgi:hypothetical protein|tara:strand:- start:371 stop:472 length:102 start_codon:yes stop_codon:yes gene_type:complete